MRTCFTRSLARRAVAAPAASLAALTMSRATVSRRFASEMQCPFSGTRRTLDAAPPTGGSDAAPAAAADEGPISAETIRLTRENWALVRGDLDAAAKLFYTNLFTLAPVVAETIFSGVDMKVQGKRLMTMIDTAMGMLDDVPALVPALFACGERHLAYGSTEAQYAVVGQNLINTLKAALGDKMTEAHLQAWLKLYAVIQDVMIQGQRKAEKDLLALPTPKAKVASVTDVSPDTKKITIAFPEDQGLEMAMQPGGHVMVEARLIKDSYVHRPYTPTAIGKGQIELIVKKYAGGKGSGYLHGLTAGDDVIVRGPVAPCFDLAAATPSTKRLVLVAGGTGAAPMLSLAKAALSAGQIGTVAVLACFADAEHTLLKAELDAIAAGSGGKATVKYHYGLFDAAAAAGTGVEGDTVVVCGPPGMSDAAKEVFKPLGERLTVM